MEEAKVTDERSLEEFLKDDPQPVSAETAQRITEQLQPEETQAGTEEAAPTTEIPQMNLGDITKIAVNLYKGISNRIYAMVKDRPAPEWDKETTEALNEAARNFLKGYNVPMSPGWQLLITVATVEIMRYTLPQNP